MYFAVFHALCKPLISIESKLYCYSIQGYLENVRPALWQQFGEGPLLFQHDSASLYKASSI